MGNYITTNPPKDNSHHKGAVRNLSQTHNLKSGNG